MRTLVSLLVVAALGLPAVPADARYLLMSTCAGGTVEVPLGDGDTPPGNDRDQCAKACHMGDMRRKKGDAGPDGLPCC